MTPTVLTCHARQSAEPDVDCTRQFPEGVALIESTANLQRIYTGSGAANLNAAPDRTWGLPWHTFDAAICRSLVTQLKKPCLACGSAQGVLDQSSSHEFCSLVQLGTYIPTLSPMGNSRLNLASAIEQRAINPDKDFTSRSNENNVRDSEMGVPRAQATSGTTTHSQPRSAEDLASGSGPLREAERAAGNMRAMMNLDCAVRGQWGAACSQAARRFLGRR